MSEREVLSQDEVDALTEKVEDGTIPTTDKNGDQEYSLIDFSNQERVVRSQFPVLSRIHDRFAKKLVISLYDLLAHEVEIESQELKILKFSEFMSSLKMPSAINYVRFSPLRGKGFIVYHPELAFNFVETYFGGNGRYEANIEEREFTTTEQRVTQVVLGIILRDLQEAWTPIIPVQLEGIGFEMNPQMINGASAEDIMVISPFEFKFEDRVAQMDIVMSYTMLEPFREQLDVGSARSDDDIDPNWVRSLREEILDSPLEISSTLAETNLSLRQVMALKPGDFIPIELPEEVTVKIEGIPTFRAKYGASHDKCALKINRQMRF